MTDYYISGDGPLRRVTKAEYDETFQRQIDKSSVSGAWTRLDQMTDMENRIASVLAYLSNLPCSNCEHVHENRCTTVIHGPDLSCGCTSGPSDVVVDIRELLGDKP